tara:strand:+ start:66 stop:275 length:210 start_codon:yes stop_codon:yes gene_type:complete
MKLIIIFIIKIYQNTLGVLFRGNCRFHPTCSEYVIQAIHKYGVVRGGYCGVIRLLRCHPFSKHFGVDEV